MPEIARALRVSTDVLLGVASMTRAARPANSRLERRLQQIEKLSAKEKRQILQFLDTFLEREKLRQRIGAAG